MNEFNQGELNHLTRISKINIFIKILSAKESNQGDLNRLTRISKINIFIKNLFDERVQPRRVESLDSKF